MKILLLLIILIVGGVGFLAYKGSGVSPGQNIQTPSTDATLKPVVNIASNSIIKSPLAISGTVPAGWMFEGIFPVKILDSSRAVLTQKQAKEVIPGSWQNGNPIEFSATVNFKTTDSSGFILLENDNPSGLPQNAKSLEIPVKF